MPFGSIPGLRRLCFALVLLILSCIELAVWSRTTGFPINTIRCTFSMLTMILNLVFKMSQSQHISIIIFR
jgi:hypothetical protein